MNWKDYAACRDVDPIIFFPDNNTTRRKDEAVAKAVCLTCLVRAQCLDRALACHEVGIWGGTNEKERKLIQRRYVRPTLVGRAAAV